MEPDALAPTGLGGERSGASPRALNEEAFGLADGTDSRSDRPPVGPVPNATKPPKRRVVGIDAARGVALLGMMAIHSLYANDDQGNPTLSFTLTAGRSAALFAVLAGVGISMTTGRRRVAVGREGLAATASLVARAFALVVIGLALGTTDSTYGTVILVYYGALFVLAIPLLFLPTRALVVIGAVVALVVPVLSHLVRPGLPASLEDHPTVAYLMESPVRVLADVFVTGEYPALPWVAYLCVGMAIGRLQMSSLKVARRLLGIGVALAVAAKLAAWVALGPLGGSDKIFAAAATPGSTVTRAQVSQILAFGGPGTTPPNTWWWLTIAAPHTSTPLDLMHTIGTAMAVIALMLLLTDAARPTRAVQASLVLKPLRSAGSMTLTLYAAHILFVNSPLDVLGAIPGYMVQVVVAMMFALVWLSLKRSGPLESVVTKLSHRARDAVLSRSADGAPKAP